MAQISFFTDPAGRAPQELLSAWPSLVDVAESAGSSGARVSVIQASSHTATLTRRFATYHFLPFGPASSPAQSADFTSLIDALAPDVIHVHGLSYPREVLSLVQRLPNAAIVLQDHANPVPRFWRRAALRRSLCAISAVSFCCREQARAYVEAGLLRHETPVFEIPESTTRFVPGERESARRAAGVHGAPLVLWVGHLDENKDPLTVLDGVSEAATVLPDLQLWCCFGTAPLRREVERRIATDPRLSGRVHLLGNVSHEQVGELMRAADIFVLGSHRESTGFALIEALACGVSPVVTDIPSFRALTSGGKVGSLWTPGDARSLAAAIVEVAKTTGPDTRVRMREHFERELSFESLGAKLVAMYEHVAERKRRAGGCAATSVAGAAIGAPE